MQRSPDFRGRKAVARDVQRRTKDNSRLLSAFLICVITRFLTPKTRSTGKLSGFDGLNCHSQKELRFKVWTTLELPRFVECQILGLWVPRTNKVITLFGLWLKRVPRNSLNIFRKQNENFNYYRCKLK